MEKHCLNKYWLIGPGVIAIILLVLALVHDFMPEIRLLMDLTPAHRAELLTMIRSNGIRNLIFMLGNERDSGPLQRRYLRFCRSLLRPVDQSFG